MRQPAVLVGLMIAAAMPPAAAQHQHAAPSEKPVALLAGMGTHRHPIATRSEQAQKFFDQGLAMLYGFNRYEALRSFRKAAELDPAALMPHWGMAMATGPHINMDLDGDYNAEESCKAVRKGMDLHAKAPEHERAYIDAVASRCPSYDAAKYRAAMRALMERSPDDTDAATFYVESIMIPVRWKWWRSDGTPAEGMEEAVRLLELVMRRNPDHPGANHFYIHAVEASPSPERAIPSAQRLMGIVPAAGHLVHMPGHIWMQLGDFEMVAATNERAVAVDREYMKTTGLSGGAYAGYYVHNLHFVAVARQMQGRIADAIRSAEELATAAAPLVSEMAAMVDAFVPAPMFAMLRFQQWDRILALKPPDERLHATTAIWHMARAVALKAKGRNAEARKEREMFLASRAKTPPDWAWLTNKASDILAIAGLVMDARLASTDREAIPLWRQAVEIEGRLIYDEPPPWFYPVRESLGGALLRAGQAAEAEQVFREGLRRGPRNGRLLFGLMESLKAQAKTAAAESVRREFESAWKRADVALRVADL